MHHHALRKERRNTLRPADQGLDARDSIRDTRGAFFAAVLGTAAIYPLDEFIWVRCGVAHAFGLVDH
jgi:hypothetical protein